VADLQDTDINHFAQTTTDDKKWVKDAEVAYIANEHIEAKSQNGEEVKWGFSSDTETGVFSGAGNIVTLVTGDKLLGIGKNAFRGCSSLNGIQLGNGTTTIHNYAFADCINMRSVDIDLHSNVQVIGEHAFYNCQGLLEFTMPIAVSKIGDGAFEGCSSLISVALTGSDYNVSLQTIGDHVFKGCTSLMELTFPSGVKQNNLPQLRLSLVEGCTSLASITIPDRSLTFSETDSFTGTGTPFGFEEFIAQVGEEFYFASYGTSQLHNTATEQSIAFKYLDSPYLYEKVIKEKNDNGAETGLEITYRVDESNNLQEFEMDEGVENVEIPGSIGPYKILTIGSESFQNNCYLRKITIPSSITSIEEYAFQGCHNLKDVIFEEPINVSSIGTGAFNTQIVPTGKLCQSPDDGSTCVDHVNQVSQPILTFTGKVDPQSTPFQFAMDPENTINRGSQKKTYITFFSGWPTNLTIQYNPDTNLNELVDYPRYTDLRNGTLAPSDAAVHGDEYPYLTPDQKVAAIDAVNAYENYVKRGGAQPTQDQMEIVNASLNIVIPNGVEGIAEGLFSGVGVSGNSIGAPDNEMQSVQMEAVSSVPDYAFYGCQGLQTVIMLPSDNPNGDSIGNYAFGNCDELTNVRLSDNVTRMGLRPFKECEKLTYVDFVDSPYFVCDNGIIYGLDSAGNKNRIVECLETRGSTGEYSIGASMVSKSELEGVESIQDEAFMGCLGIGDVNLSTSKISEIPVSCFEDTTNLFSVEMPNTTRTIRERAFKNSGVRSLTIPESVSYIDSSAFTNQDGGVNKNITISAVEGSAAETFANLYGLTLGEPLVRTFQVTFFNWDDTILSVQDVPLGEDAVPPADPVREGYTFTGWRPDYTQVARELSVYAFYDRTLEDLDEAKHVVTFYDWNDEIVSRQTVYDGEDAITPVAPEREGYNFTGWRQSYTNVKEDIDVYAEYEPIPVVIEDEVTYTVTFYNYDQTIVSRQNVEPGGTPVTPVSPTRSGYTFTGWLPSYTTITKDLDIFAQYEQKKKTGSSTSTSDSESDNQSGDSDGGDSGSGSDSGSGKGSGSSAKTYVATITSGSGSGSYTAGTIVTISALDIPGKNFSNWATTATDIMISDVTARTATFVMPEHAVTIEAKYTTTSTTTNRVAGATASGNTTPRRTINNGTRVDITKSGISNRDVASASVSGSSDNFVVKITEDENARMLVEQALLAEYGSLENIKYFAMDISLYDSTGQNKINNTDGLSVTITIPIPDALAEYAGNNKIAGVVSGRLDKLNPRFTTIDGVPCVSFVATHFSPYTAYVDTSNLTVGTVQDRTPTTGDPIHPKWFLVIGLALLSILMFGARGSKKKVVIEA